MSTNGAVVVPGTIAAMIVLVILGKFTPLRVVAQWMLFQIPGVGRLAREATIARFGVILGGLLQAGVPVVEGMQSLVDVTPIVSYRKFYQKLLDRVQLGDSFAKSFAGIRGSQKILPPTVQQLVMTGERSGALASILLKVADIYDRKASETAQKLPVILEPLLLLFIGGLVGTIAFAIIVPIYGIVGSVGR
jgi:type IV pilus assembly protein PilC